MDWFFGAGQTSVFESVDQAAAKSRATHAELSDLRSFGVASDVIEMVGAVNAVPDDARRILQCNVCAAVVAAS